MGFTKRFPKKIPGSTYPEWIDIALTEQEEREEEEKARLANRHILEQCIDDARSMLKSKNLDYSDPNTIDLAVSLFEKRASHVVYFKEGRCKEKFDQLKS